MLTAYIAGHRKHPDATRGLRGAVHLRQAEAIQKKFDKIENKEEKAMTKIQELRTKRQTLANDAHQKLVKSRKIVRATLSEDIAEDFVE